MRGEIEIAGRRVGDGHPCFIVAEIGINHDGDLSKAHELMRMAKLAGADAVKFQKRTPELSTPQEMWDQPKLTPWGETMPYIEYRRRMEFTVEQWFSIHDYAHHLGILWFSSVWDFKAVQFFSLENPGLDMCAYKVPSAKITDEALLEHVIYAGRPVIMSTGMSTWEEIQKAVTTLKGRVPLAVMHCHSAYPAPVNELNLNMIESWRNGVKGFDEIPIGYSGHETGLATTVVAVALGASIVERHITLDRAGSGSDQAASVEPQGFAKIVRDIRSVETALGERHNPKRKVMESELAARKKLRG